MKAILTVHAQWDARGYPLFLAGSILAMFNLINVTHGAGMLALVPGGLFELILPIWLFAKGFTSPLPVPMVER